MSTRQATGSACEPWPCSNSVSAIEDLSAELANFRLEDFPHSISELVFHMNYCLQEQFAALIGELVEMAKSPCSGA
jgi:hypothetical protein